MTVKDIAEKLGLGIATCETGLDRKVCGVYCSDLLSFAMSKAPSGCAWITVINNINVIAVASLADVACVVLAEGVLPDQKTLEKASQQGIPVLKSDFPAFETAKSIFDCINEN